MQPQRIHAPFDLYSAAFPEIGIVFLSEVEWTVYRNNRVHDHAEIQLLWILDGTMGIHIDGQSIDYSPGGCYVIPAKRSHAVFQSPRDPRVHFIDMRLTPDKNCTLTSFVESLGGQIPFRLNAPRLKTLSTQLRQTLALSRPHLLARLQAVLWEMLAELTTDVRTDNAARAATLQRIRTGDNAMKDRLAQALDVGAVAKTVGLSRSQLTRLYKKHLGIGPAERLRQLRVEKARELLASSTLAVKEIAYVCGFVCPNHFCRVFQQLSGTTPTEYRVTANSKSEVRNPKAGFNVEVQHL